MTRDRGAHRFPCPAGQHNYKYIVDGEWRADTSQPTRCDAIGNVNNIVTVEEIEEDTADQEYSQTIPTIGLGLFAEPNKQPGMLPRPLDHTPLNRQQQDTGKIYLDPALGGASPKAKGQRDPSLLPLPEHVVLTHLYRANTPTLTHYGLTVRLQRKFVTTIVYYHSAGVLIERQRLSEEAMLSGLPLRVDETLSQCCAV
ncbi:5'-AMP-activated protein kinase beta subunit interation domain [Carpediemonas membranifera]|uniref:5'-AMP-activated protein kinase beta subunit interation domain n=1 Tax=Carpediemonas membranifera TaxID=201153 RepID=A0A8J6AX52_9EUKA|nr:5'-AMP-activated protein kinase beta subunit interation domain [Carpediemonas membranifera]|eukprot:KAG9397051.1 5'-AMP-activated protein kinase beta subunit interation domain [Carpediemonas membranifera]